MGLERKLFANRFLLLAGSIVFDFQTSLTDIQQKVQDLINNGHFPKDLSGNLLTVLGLTATLITGGKSNDLFCDTHVNTLNKNILNVGNVCLKIHIVFAKYLKLSGALYLDITTNSTPFLHKYPILA